jgi:hypothetical protein
LYEYFNKDLLCNYGLIIKLYEMGGYRVLLKLLDVKWELGFGQGFVVFWWVWSTWDRVVIS